MAAFQGIHVLPAKNSYVWLQIKCDFLTDMQSDPMYRYFRTQHNKIDLIWITKFADSNQI